MTPFGGVENSDLLAGLVILASIVSVAASWIISSAVLRIYRGRVQRNMALGRPNAFSFQPTIGPAATTAAVVIRPVNQIADGPLMADARRKSRRTQILMVIAALVYGLGGALITMALDDMHLTPLKTLVIMLLYAWPIAPTLVAQSADQRPITTALVWSVYFAILIAAVWIGGVHSVIQVLLLIVLEIAIPAILVVALGVRPVRGVSWLVSPTLLLVTLALWMGQWPAQYAMAGVSFDRIAYVYLAAMIICLAILAIYIVGFVEAYRRKWLGDQSLLIVQWWFVVTFWHVVDFVSPHGWPGLVALLPMVLAGAVIVIGWRLTGRETGPPKRLLLLRTFGAQNRSTTLLRELTRRWRWIGSIDLVTAPDVASEVLSPADFIDFLRGKLSARFIDGPDALQRRLAEVDLRPDADGRYRVNEFLCHVDDWKPLLEVLVSTADVVVIDVRGFGAGHLGVQHELWRLVNLIDLRRVVAIVDDTTDFAALQATLDQASASAGAGAPFRYGGSTEFGVVHVQTAGTQDPRPILNAVFGAAAAGVSG